MTLCLTYKYRNEGNIPRAMSISDSLITVIGPKQEKAIGSYLPSHTEIRHQTPKGTKIQIVSALKNDGQTKDFVFSIAGAVSLGLQSLIYLDSVFKTFYDDYSFEEYLGLIEQTLGEFWHDAYDKEIDYLMTASSDSGKAKIFRIRGTGENSKLNFEEIQSENGITLSAIGDKAEETRSAILGEVNALMCAKMDINSALDLACLRGIKSAIENPSQNFIGGNIQASLLVDNKAQYIALDGEHVIR